MVVLPADTAVTTPVLPTVATIVFMLLHTPPAVASRNVLVLPAQTAPLPVIVPAAGRALTVTPAEAINVPQLPLTFKNKVAVPAATPVTTPADLNRALVAA